MLLEARQFIVDHPARFLSALGTHVALSACALALATLIAVPAGILLSRTPRPALVAITTANNGRTPPSLAVLAPLMPPLRPRFAPSLFALTPLAGPPLLLQT